MGNQCKNCIKSLYESSSEDSLDKYIKKGGNKKLQEYHTETARAPPTTLYFDNPTKLVNHCSLRGRIK